jgi:hypothetical protein
VADLYGSGDYGADAYAGAVELDGYGSGLYGMGVYGGGGAAPAYGGGAAGAPRKRPVPRRVGVTLPQDDEAAVALVLTLL